MDRKIAKAFLQLCGVAFAGAALSLTIIGFIRAPEVAAITLGIVVFVFIFVWAVAVMER